MPRTKITKDAALAPNEVKVPLSGEQQYRLNLALRRCASARELAKMYAQASAESEAHLWDDVAQIAGPLYTKRLWNLSRLPDDAVELVHRPLPAGRNFAKR